MAAITEELAAHGDAPLADSEPAPAEQAGAPDPRADRRASGGAAGRDTMDDLADEMLRESPETAPAAPGKRGRRRTVGYEDGARVGSLPPQELGAAADLEAFQLLSFVVRGTNVRQLASRRTRREFVATRLRRRLPVESLEDVQRIDVTPWTEKDTVVVRVWCKVR
jgi:hypothetical protein